MVRRITILLVAVLVLSVGCGAVDTTIEGAANVSLDGLTMIAFRNGTTGELTEITAPGMISEFTAYLESFRLKKSRDQAGRTGYRWYADFYRGEEKLLRVTFVSPLNVNGTYYDILEPKPDPDFIDRFVAGESQAAYTRVLFSPGPVGYALPDGVRRPGEEVSLHLYPKGKAVQLGPVEYTLTRLDEVNHRKAVILQREGESVGKRAYFSATLPDDAPAVYRIAAAIRDESGVILDELVGYIYVPPQEMATELTLDKKTYHPGETAVLALHNTGPTSLFFGQPYEIEKYLSGAWVPDDSFMPDLWLHVGHFAHPGETFNQDISLAGAAPGRYRLSKEVSAQGTPLSETLYAEFEVK